jgi:hypothetical protein
MLYSLICRNIVAGLALLITVCSLAVIPARSADLGGDCCADLEERVAELEATTVRKGNRKVSVTISGWVIKTINWWDDGVEKNVYVGDKGYPIASNFVLSGSAQIATGWTAGYTMQVEVPGGVFSFATNQIQDDRGIVTDFRGVDALTSFMWVESDKWGTLNWGLLHPATDNVALLPDLSGTVLESNALFQEGAGFFLRPKGVSKNEAGLLNLTWGNFLWCEGLNAGIGADCGVPLNGVRYDSPVFSGFSVSGGYSEDNVLDIAVKYADDWGNFKTSAAYGYTHTTDERFTSGGGGLYGTKENADLHQVGASVMHMPTGLFVYGMYAAEDANPTPAFAAIPNVRGAKNDTQSWFSKVGIKRTWNPLGATVLWGEAGQYKDMFGDLKGVELCGAGLLTTFGGELAPACRNSTGTAYVTESEIDRWGLGMVQEIDSAAMHVFLRWQHQELDATFKTRTGDAVNQGFDDWDLIQAGGIIFF